MDLTDYDPSDVGGHTRTMHNGMKPTDEQAEIFQAITDTGDHVTVEALAGTGKTTTVVEAANRLVEDTPTKAGDVLFLAFNRAISRELDGKLPDGMWNKTCHAQGLSLIGTHTDHDFTVDDDREKSKDILKDVYPGRLLGDVGYRPLRRLADMSKVHLVTEDDDPMESIEKVFRAYGLALEVPPQHREVAVQRMPEVLEAMFEDWRRIEFSDMVWFPVKDDLYHFPKDLVFVDEAQDLNPLQHEMVLRLVGSDGRCVQVGDPKQSLYGFRGAVPESMENLAASLETRTHRDVTRLPLTKTFRCPEHVVDLVQGIVPEYEAYRDEEGTIRHAGPMEWDIFEPGDIVLCGKNAPLLRCAYRLVSQRRPVMMRGRSIGDGLKGVIEYVAGTNRKGNIDRSVTDGEFLAGLEEWHERQLADLDPEDEEARAKVKDRFECLKMVAGEVENTGQMLDFLDDIFPSRGEEKVAWDRVIQLSTVHRIKGKEADRVFILNSAEDLTFGAQGENLAYVAATRAKEELTFMGSLPPVFQARCGGLEWAPPEERKVRPEPDRQEGFTVSDDEGGA